MAVTKTLESDGEPTNALAAEILEIRQTVIELGGELGLLAEHMALNRIVAADGENPCEGIAKTSDAFAAEVQILYLRYKLSK